MVPKKPLQQQADYPTASECARFPSDMTLRKHGFTIHARPNGKEAQWERAGIIYTESEARRIISQEAKK